MAIVRLVDVLDINNKEMDFRFDKEFSRWIGVLLIAVIVGMIGHVLRIDHIDHVSDLGGGSAIQLDDRTPTGYERSLRKLIVSERNVESYQWIMQVQEMGARDVLSLKHVDYDNAPDGRAVLSPSLYRWWLGGIALLISTLTGESFGVAVEGAALYADPLLQLLAIGGATFLLCRLSWRSAALFAAGMVSLFPLGAGFTPGQPDDSVFAVIFTLFSVLPLLVGFAMAAKESHVATNRYLTAIAGFSGGLGLWISVSGGGIILLFIFLAGLLFGMSRRLRKAKAVEGVVSQPIVKWRIWAWSGSLAVMIAWILENGPHLFDSEAWRLNFVNPVHALVWLVFAELLVFVDRAGVRTGKLKKASVALFALVGLFLLFKIFTAEVDWVVNEIGDDLSRIPMLGDKGSIATLFEEGGMSGVLVLAMGIPLLLPVFSARALMKTKGSESSRGLFIVGLVPLVAVSIFALFDLGWWAHFDVLALAFGVVTLALVEVSPRLRMAIIGVVVCSLIFGLALVFKDLSGVSRLKVNQSEVVALVERHMANWLSLRLDAEDAVVLAPPNTSASLAFYGDLKQLGTPYPENIDGFSAAVRLSSATTADEAKAIADSRRVEFIVNPSWDPFLEEYARIGSKEFDQTFVAMLNRWLPPLWLKPIDFRIPRIEGFDSEGVILFRSVEVQEREDALARLIEYFIDSGRGEQALQAQAALSAGFPDALVSQITAAELAAALGRKREFNEAVNAIQSMLKVGKDEYLEWDFRVNLALVLLRAEKTSAAKQQIAKCLANVDRERMLGLSEASLSMIAQMCEAFRLEITDAELARHLEKLSLMKRR